MNYNAIRQEIRSRTDTAIDVVQILNSINIDSTKDGFIRVRPDDDNPHYGSGEHYSDIVTLLFDSYRTFDSLPETMQWLCGELGIEWEVSDE